MLIEIRINFLSFQNDEILEILCSPLAVLVRTNERSELCETVCRMAGTEIYDFEGGKIIKIYQSIKSKNSLLSCKNYS